MSNGGEIGAPMLGGWSDPRPPTTEDQCVLHKVKSQYEAQTKMNPGEFQAVLVRTQVVAGLNYLFKVFTGEDTYSHLKVYKPLPYTNEEPVLEGYLLNMTMDDELEDFGDENGVEACS